ncbi:MAG: energy-coupling factor ABC transporter permease [Thiotrichales bacterium]
MNIPADTLSPFLEWTALALFCGVFVVALSTAPWRILRESESLHVFLGALTVSLVLWNLRAAVVPGFEFHFFGLTALCLMFEWQFAVIAAALLTAVSTWKVGAPWQLWGANALLLGVLPILWVRGLLYISQRRLPRHFFVYIFVNTFFAAALSVLLIGATASLLMAGAAGYGQLDLADEYWISLWLLAFPEGLMNGFIITLMVVYRPEWVATFHDRWYLKGK